MLRRRKPGGGGGRGLFGRKAPDRPARSISPMLLQAHRLFSWRQYLPAADLYERLAEGALTREPARAPHLFLQSGRARIAGGQIEHGMGQIRRGLEMLLTQQRYTELQRVAWRVEQGLANNGLEQQAEQIRNWLAGLEPTETVIDWRTAPTVAPARIRLPLSCSSCGGVVDPTEVEWVDAITAECSYCGSLLRGEEV